MISSSQILLLHKVTLVHWSHPYPPVSQKETKSGGGVCQKKTNSYVHWTIGMCRKLTIKMVVSQKVMGGLCHQIHKHNMMSLMDGQLLIKR